MIVGVSSIAGRMSQDQERDVRDAIIKAVDKGCMTKYPRVVQAINEFYTCTGDLKYLAVLDEICKLGVMDMRLVLKKAELRIEAMENLSFLEVVKLQGELQA